MPLPGAHFVVAQQDSKAVALLESGAVSVHLGTGCPGPPCPRVPLGSPSRDVGQAELLLGLGVLGQLPCPAAAAAAAPWAAPAWAMLYPQGCEPLH